MRRGLLSAVGAAAPIVFVTASLAGCSKKAGAGGGWAARFRMSRICRIERCPGLLQGGGRLDGHTVDAPKIPVDQASLVQSDLQRLDDLSKHAFAPPLGRNGGIRSAGGRPATAHAQVGRSARRDRPRVDGWRR